MCLDQDLVVQASLSVKVQDSGLTLRIKLISSSVISSKNPKLQTLNSKHP